VVCFDPARISRQAQVLGYVIDRLAAVEVDLLVPSMAESVITAEHGAVPAVRPATVSLLGLQADHAHRVSHTSRRPPGGGPIESGPKDLDERGHGRAHEQFDISIPRDGGIQDLLAEAAVRSTTPSPLGQRPTKPPAAHHR
jgi:hypothetical protein